MTDLWQATVPALRRFFDTGQASPVEALESYAARIAEVEPHVHAFAHLDLERALSAAKNATDDLARRRPIGALHGVPVAVKELIDVEGMPISFGSDVYRDRLATKDALGVARLRSAGAIVVGTTRAHEFGWGMTSQHSRRGGPRNPWRTERIPGGSSGGSAAAVAARLVPIALGTDTGGSCRLPASFCGVVGWKGSHRAAPMDGVVPLAPTLDHLGVLAADLASTRTAASVLAERPARAGATAVPALAAERLRVGFLSDTGLPTAHPANAAALNSVRQHLQAAGATVIDTPIANLDAVTTMFATRQGVEAYYVHHRLLKTFPSRADLYGTDVRQRLERAAELSLDDYLSAGLLVQRLATALADAFRQVDVICTLITPCAPPLATTPDTVSRNGKDIPLRELVPPFTAMQNLCGLPSVAVPVGLGEDELPMGVQLFGPAGSDDTVLAVGAFLEALLDIPRAWPFAAPASQPRDSRKGATP